MKLAASNIALPAYDHVRELRTMRELGLEGIEIAPSRVWKDTWKGLSQGSVRLYRKQIEAAGLRTVGLHSLFFDHPELGLFCSDEYRSETLEFMVHLSRVCRDLGGKTLIYGGGRRRGNIPKEEAYSRAIEFCAALCERIQNHGTSYCFEPLGSNKMDFINTVAESLFIVKAVKSASLRVQLDAEALAHNHEIFEQTFLDVRPYLVHVHANEPNFEILGSSGKVDHKSIGEFLRAINYEGYVSIEQKMIGNKNIKEALAQSIAILSKCYG